MSASMSDICRDADADWRDAQRRMSDLTSYYRWVLSLVRDYVGERVLEVGCGIGNFTQLLAKRCGYVAVADIDRIALCTARQRLAGRANVEFFDLDLDNGTGNVPQGSFDTIVCLDVIEHLADDESALRLLTNYSRPGGYLIVKAPACPWLYGDVDRASGHFRRYSTTALAAVAQRAGWHPLSSRYMNASGVLPYWFTSRILRKRASFSRTFSKRQWRIVRTIIPVARLIDAILGPPIGQSALLVAQPCPSA